MSSADPFSNKHPQSTSVSRETAAKLFASFNKYLPLNAAERADLAARVSERRIKRRQFILQEDDICRHYTFVAEGCFKKFQVDQKGTEHNLQFAAENDWIMEIKQATGKSVGLHIRQRIVLEAVRQAKLTGASMKEVAYDLGFNDNAHFSKFFKKVAGQSFSDVRKCHSYVAAGACGDDLDEIDAPASVKSVIRDSQATASMRLR